MFSRDKQTVKSIKSAATGPASEPDDVAEQLHSTRFPHTGVLRKGDTIKT